MVRQGPRAATASMRGMPDPVHARGDRKDTRRSVVLATRPATPESRCGLWSTYRPGCFAQAGVVLVKKRALATSPQPWCGSDWFIDQIPSPPASRKIKGVSRRSGTGRSAHQATDRWLLHDDDVDLA